MKKEAGATSERMQQMPNPQFLDISSPFESGNKPIGVIAKSLVTRKEGAYVWWRNFIVPSINPKNGKDALANYLMRLMLSFNVDIVIGPAIDVDKSDAKTGKIKILAKSRFNNYGYYVEASERPQFNFKFAIEGPESYDDLVEKLNEQGKPNAIDETFTKVRRNLPLSK